MDETTKSPGLGCPASNTLSLISRLEVVTGDVEAKLFPSTLMEDGLDGPPSTRLEMVNGSLETLCSRFEKISLELNKLEN